MKKIILVMMSVFFGALLAGCQTSEPLVKDQGIQTISGTVFYRERIALPEDAAVTLVLEDVSLADAPAKVIAKHKFITNGKQVPLSFDLAYDSKKIIANHRYNVRARIEVNGRLRFISDTIVPVITDEANTRNVEIMVVGVR
ncbi:MULTISPECIES: YbaY family lipoprotein [Vibrio]|uniref:YbaY family lipoprotein n=2 Tax=Vibrionaceae TaxID=641 RepID=UPI000505E20C|nr:MULTISPECIES: YbaY family lipoprotein [Vibrio]EGQ7852021.1 lipo-like protein [Vibrio vulnificus]EHD0099939.1 lipo-like protein [Vibrio vulnificus]EID4417570.1 YbaY family lipoprotein [Vibrio vulnificus]EJL6391474.1 YbaY family lipoprotein [Vibrio vulnificus]ELV8804724.1 YbaY family lipoprotein [Vibrio vulnificus]